MAEDYRWTLRGVSRAYAERASAAAVRRGITLGEYVTEALERQYKAEHETAFEIVAPRAAAVADMALVERVVAAAVSLASEPAVPKQLRSRVNRLLRESLGGVKAPAGLQTLLLQTATETAMPDREQETPEQATPEALARAT